MWKGMKKIISSNDFNHTLPTAIPMNNETITNPSDVSNGFNNYWLQLLLTDVQSSIRFSKKIYFDYLPPLNIESFIITLNNCTEVSNISTLNQDKSDIPNSNPTKIVKLLNKVTSD